MTAAEAYESMKQTVQSLLQSGYKMSEILNMRLDDIELFNDLLDTENTVENELDDDFLSLLGA